MDPTTQPQSTDPTLQAPPASSQDLPITPGASGVASLVPPGAPMTQSQMVSSLTSMMAQIQSKYQAFNAKKFSSSNVVNEQQGGALRQIFDLFKSQGVDPSNPSQVGAFLDQLKKANPELYQQFVGALQVILGDDTMTSTTPPITNAPETPLPAAPAVSPTDATPAAPDATTNMNINPNDQTVPQNV